MGRKLSLCQYNRGRKALPRPRFDPPTVSYPPDDGAGKVNGQANVANKCGRQKTKSIPCGGLYSINQESSSSGKLIPPKYIPE